MLPAHKKMQDNEDFFLDTRLIFKTCPGKGGGIYGHPAYSGTKYISAQSLALSVLLYSFWYNFIVLSP